MGADLDGKSPDTTLSGLFEAARRSFLPQEWASGLGNSRYPETVSYNKQAQSTPHSNRRPPSPPAPLPQHRLCHCRAGPSSAAKGTFTCPEKKNKNQKQNNQKQKTKSGTQSHTQMPLCPKPGLRLDAPSPGLCRMNKDVPRLACASDSGRWM